MTGEVDTTLMDKAMEQGNLEVTKFLFDRGQTCSYQAIVKVGRNGHFDLFKFVVDNQDELAKRVGKKTYGCTFDDALAAAAANNQLRAIQWWTINQGWQISERVLEAAIKAGHTDVIKWIVDNIVSMYKSRSCNMITDGLNTQIGSGNTELACYLKDNTEFFKSELFKPDECGRTSIEVHLKRWMIENGLLVESNKPTLAVESATATVEPTPTCPTQPPTVDRKKTKRDIVEHIDEYMAEQMRLATVQGDKELADWIDSRQDAIVIVLELE